MMFYGAGYTGRVILAAVMIIFFLFLTSARNAVWVNDFTFWDDAVRKSPDKARTNTEIAIVCYRSGLIERSIYHYRRALGISPDSARAHNGLGLAYESRGFVGPAIDHYKAALLLKPDYADAHYNLGLAYLHPANRDVARARKEFEAALQAEPGHSKARQFLGYVSQLDSVAPGNRSR